MIPQTGQIWKHKGSGNTFKLLERINEGDDKYPSFKVQVIVGNYYWDWVQFGPGTMNKWVFVA